MVENICLYCVLGIIVFFILLLVIPLFLALLLDLTTRKTRYDTVKEIAMTDARNANKSLIVFEDKGGFVYDPSTKTFNNFEGSMPDIVDRLADACCYILVNRKLEYIEPTQVSAIIDDLRRASDNNLYLVNYETGSPDFLTNSELKTVMLKSYYMPGDAINWKSTSNFQKKFEKIYSTLGLTPKNNDDQNTSPTSPISPVAPSLPVAPTSPANPASESNDDDFDESDDL